MRIARWYMRERSGVPGVSFGSRRRYGNRVTVSPRTNGFSTAMNAQR